MWCASHAGAGHRRRCAAVAGLSLAAARRCRLLRCVEVNSQGRPPFEAAAARLAVPLGGSDGGPDGAGDGCKYEYLVSTAAAAAANGAFAGVDVVTVDPPRKVHLPRHTLQDTAPDASWFWFDLL